MTKVRMLVDRAMIISCDLNLLSATRRLASCLTDKTIETYVRISRGSLTRKGGQLSSH